MEIGILIPVLAALMSSFIIQFETPPDLMSNVWYVLIVEVSRSTMDLVLGQNSQTFHNSSSLFFSAFIMLVVSSNAENKRLLFMCLNVTWAYNIFTTTELRQSCDIPATVLKQS